MAFKKLCAKVGCNNLADIGQRFCETHKHLAAEQTKEYDRKIRHEIDKQYTEFYHSPEWIKLRGFILHKYKGLDLYAYYAKQQIIPAKTVHHIVEIKENWDLRMTINNLVPVSDKSHRLIHSLYKKDLRGTQELLKSLIVRWNEQFQGGGRV